MKGLLNFVLAAFIVGFLMLAGARQMEKQLESLNAVKQGMKP